MQEVIRGGSMTQKDKLRRLQEMCARPEGWLLQKCLEGNGWNPVRGCLEGFPCWSEAVHRLTVSLNALASQRMPPPLPKQRRVAPLEAPSSPTGKPPPRGSSSQGSLSPSSVGLGSITKNETTQWRRCHTEGMTLCRKTSQGNITCLPSLRCVGRPVFKGCP